MNKILLVEENQNTVQKALEHLSQAGFEMLSAHDGLEGLQIAKEKIPDLIITDALIPRMSGYELCKAIKLDYDIKSIPIVVMTEKHRMEDSFMYLGVKDFLNKPIILDELESLVRNKLNYTTTMQLNKSKVLIYGRPEILSCCHQLLKNDRFWSAHYSDRLDSFMQSAKRYSPDVILIDILLEEMPADEMILKLTAELKNTIFLTYYSVNSGESDRIAEQANMIKVRYMKDLSLMAGAKEYLGAFNPVTFMNLINAYRREFNFLI